MHKESRREMRVVLEKYVGLIDDKTVLDLGSYDVCGTYKVLIPENNFYIGIDIVAGPNVNVVMPKFIIPMKSNSVDVVMCGQVLEHCTNPFKLVAEVHRVLKPGGFAFLVAPFIWHEHRFPIDCFRYLPDGMASVIKESGLNVLEAYLKPVTSQAKGYKDCWGIGKK